VALVYLGLALKDLIRIAEFVVAIGHPNPHAYIELLRLRLEAMYRNKNPGVVGRRAGTNEWMLNPTPYVAVVRWVGSDAKIYRVLPSATMKVARYPQHGLADAPAYSS
jgi:hypothetical protein